MRGRAAITASKTRSLSQCGVCTTGLRHMVTVQDSVENVEHAAAQPSPANLQDPCRLPASVGHPAYRATLCALLGQSTMTTSSCLFRSSAGSGGLPEVQEQGGVGGGAGAGRPVPRAGAGDAGQEVLNADSLDLYHRCCEWHVQRLLYNPFELHILQLRYRIYNCICSNWSPF